MPSESFVGPEIFRSSPKDCGSVVSAFVYSKGCGRRMTTVVHLNSPEGTGAVRTVNTRSRTL